MRHLALDLASDLRGIVKYVVDLINNIEVDVIAIDIPTGLNPDMKTIIAVSVASNNNVNSLCFCFLVSKEEGGAILELLDAKFLS